MNIYTSNKKIVILGAGESGIGTALLAQAKGFEVFVSDYGKIAPNYKKELEENQINYESGSHTESKILNADIVVKSPGIPDSVSIIQKIKSKRISVISEIEFAFQYTNAQIIGITGSNGKTTTTALTAHIIKNDLPEVTTAGNIGDSFAKSVLQSKTQTYILELSSFQLDGIVNFSPKIAVLTNLSPDHLDRYDYKYENYIASKFKLIEKQTEDDFFIYDADDKDILKHLENFKPKAKHIPFSLTKKLEQGTYLTNNKIAMKMQNTEEIILNIDQLSIKGKHNVKNAMAAATISKLIGIRKETIREKLQTFKSVYHRMENVKSVNNVHYINDSKATNVNSTYFALEAVKAPIIWIVGGVDKGNDYSSLYPFVRNKVKAIICLGKDNQKIIDAFGDFVEYVNETQSMESAVKIADKIAEDNETVLLSPCCASFDLFKNYEDRGNQFKLAVNEL